MFEFSGGMVLCRLFHFEGQAASNSHVQAGTAGRLLPYSLCTSRHLLLPTSWAFNNIIAGFACAAASGDPLLGC